MPNESLEQTIYPLRKPNGWIRQAELGSDDGKQIHGLSVGVIGPSGPSSRVGTPLRSRLLGVAAIAAWFIGKNWAVEVGVGVPEDVIAIDSDERVTVLHTSAHGGLQHHPAVQVTLVAGRVENVTSSPVEVGLNGHGSVPIVSAE